MRASDTVTAAMIDLEDAAIGATRANDRLARARREYDHAHGAWEMARVQHEERIRAAELAMAEAESDASNAARRHAETRTALLEKEASAKSGWQPVPGRLAPTALVPYSRPAAVELCTDGQWRVTAWVEASVPVRVDGPIVMTSNVIASTRDGGREVIVRVKPGAEDISPEAWACLQVGAKIGLWAMDAPFSLI